MGNRLSHEQERALLIFSTHGQISNIQSLKNGRSSCTRRRRPQGCQARKGQEARNEGRTSNNRRNGCCCHRCLEGQQGIIQTRRGRETQEEEGRQEEARCQESRKKGQETPCQKGQDSQEGCRPCQKGQVGQEGCQTRSKGGCQTRRKETCSKESEEGQKSSAQEEISII